MEQELWSSENTWYIYLSTQIFVSPRCESGSTERLVLAVRPLILKCPSGHAPCGWLGGRGRLTDIIRRPRDDSVVPRHRDSATAHQRIRAPKHPSTPSSFPPVAPSTAAGLLFARYRRYLARQVLTWNRLQFFGWNAVAQRPHSLVSGTGAAGARARSDAYQQLLF